MYTYLCGNLCANMIGYLCVCIGVWCVCLWTYVCVQRTYMWCVRVCGICNGSLSQCTWIHVCIFTVMQNYNQHYYMCICVCEYMDVHICMWYMQDDIILLFHQLPIYISSRAWTTRDFHGIMRNRKVKLRCCLSKPLIYTRMHAFCVALNFLLQQEQLQAR